MLIGRAFIIFKMYFKQFYLFNNFNLTDSVVFVCYVACRAILYNKIYSTCFFFDTIISIVFCHMYSGMIDNG